jgi:deazaflavin-dependent oxidoreductase (nitroreductase family)
MITATSKQQLKLERPLIVFFYRLFARWVGGTNLLLLTTTGRKSGRRRTVSVVYMPVEDGYVIIAANVGLDTHPGWYLNLKQNPAAQVQIGRAKIEVLAEEVAPEEREALWTMWIKTKPGYTRFQAKTARKFPILVLRPVRPLTQ